MTSRARSSKSVALSASMRTRNLTMELVTGATGYIGSTLIDRLLEQGRPVRAMARNPGRLVVRPGIEAAQADVLTGEGLEAALDGVDVACYMIHSMAPAANGSGFADLDRQAAENFAACAQDAGAERVVYLG